MKTDNEYDLGFGEPPDMIHFIFIGGDDTEDGPNTGWYFWNFNDNKSVPIADSALTGYITDLYVSKHMYKNKPNYKINLRLSANKEYCIRSGVGTTFTRGILLSLNSLENFEFADSPITISVRAGSENAVFGNVYTPDKKRVFTEWDGECQLFPIINALQKKLGCTVQTKDMIENPPARGDVANSEEETKTDDKKTTNRSKSAKDPF